MSLPGVDSWLTIDQAAEQLGITRASATQAIQQLEARLGVRLLARTTRQVTPTPDGSDYYQRCSTILADLDDAEAEFSQAAHHPQGRIRIDLPDSFCRLLLIPALPDTSALLVSSVEAFEALWLRLDEATRQVLRRRPVVASSPRLAARLAQEAFAAIVIADGAAPNALLAALAADVAGGRFR